MNKTNRFGKENRNKKVTNNQRHDSADIGDDMTYGELVTIARMSRGITQKELSKISSISQGKISKIENEIIEFDSETKKIIAKALHYPESFFEQKIDYQSLPHSFFRKQKVTSAKKIEKIGSVTNLVRYQIKRLLKSVNINEFDVGPIDLEELDSSPSQIAKDLRVGWNIPPGPIKNLTSLVEKHGVIVIDFDFESRRISGLSLYNRFSGIPPIIFVNIAHPADRKRWTIAHELGHIILHHHLIIPPKKLEDEADEFASEFLLPEREVKAKLSQPDLKSLITMKLYWKVSIAALIMRARQLRKITDRQKRRLFTQYNKLGYKLKEPGDIKLETPLLIKGVIQAHIEQLGYSNDELAEMMSIFFDDFKTRYND